MKESERMREMRINHGIHPPSPRLWRINPRARMTPRRDGRVASHRDRKRPGRDGARSSQDNQQGRDGARPSRDQKLETRNGCFSFLSGTPCQGARNLI